MEAPTTAMVLALALISLALAVEVAVACARKGKTTAQPHVETTW